MSFRGELPNELQPIEIPYFTLFSSLIEFFPKMFFINSYHVIFPMSHQKKFVQVNLFSRKGQLIGPYLIICFRSTNKNKRSTQSILPFVSFSAHSGSTLKLWWPAMLKPEKLKTAARDDYTGGHESWWIYLHCPPHRALDPYRRKNLLHARS